MKSDTTAVTLPLSWLPDGVRNLTTYELHAVTLGATSGVFLGLGIGSGFYVLQLIALFLAVLLVAVTLGVVSFLTKKARVTMQDEPWYFLLPYSLFSTLGGLLALILF